MGTYYNDNGILRPIAGRGSGVNRNDVAYVETGTTASRNYDVGQLVYVSGAMYRVKSAIQSGQTFTVDTNIEATTIGGEIQRINNDLSALLDVKKKNINSASAPSGMFSVDVDVSYTGYSALGIVGFDLSRLQNLAYDIIHVKNSTTVTVGGYNSGSSTTFNGSIYVMYCKN